MTCPPYEEEEWTPEDEADLKELWRRIQSDRNQEVVDRIMELSAKHNASH